MNLKGIIAISGRPGIFKVITQGKNSVIVESMLDKKRFPAHATEKISTLEDISIFTIDEDVKLVALKESVNFGANNTGEVSVSYPTSFTNYQPKILF